MTPDAPKVCPVMSRPKDEDQCRDEEDIKTCEEVGFIIINNMPWSRVFPCLESRCMAWHPEVPTSIVCKEGYSYDYESCKSRRTAEECAGCELHRIKKAAEGFCKIIDGGRR